jgi:hypothetical protein
VPLDPDVRIQLAEGERGDLGAGQDSLLARLDPGAAGRRLVNDRVGSCVPSPEVLGQRETDQREGDPLETHASIPFRV